MDFEHKSLNEFTNSQILRTTSNVFPFAVVIIHAILQFLSSIDGRTISPRGKF